VRAFGYHSQLCNNFAISKVAARLGLAVAQWKRELKNTSEENMMNKIFSIIGAFALALGLTTGASAATITVDIAYGGADSGVSASGQFDYDLLSGTFSNVSILAGAGTLPATTFIAVAPNAGIFGTTADFVNTDAADLTGARRLAFNFSGTLADLINGVVPFLNPAGPSGDVLCSNAGCTSFSSQRGISTGGSTFALAPSPVPLPASALLLFAGLAVLGAAGKRRRV
jgi:hypothetical protein